MCRRSSLLLMLWISAAECWFWWGKYYPWDEKDNTGLSSFYKMRNMSRELLSEGYMKVRLILDVRDYHADSPSFEVGYIMGKLREKYRRMMEHYYQWRDKASGKSVFVGPGVEDIYPLHFLMTMEHVIMYEFDIAKYVELLLTHFQDDELVLYEGKRHRPSKKKDKKKGGKKRDMSDEDYMYSRRSVKEQAVKRKYHEQFLARRLGLPENYTTKSKRFLHNWPVEETWDNLRHYDDGPPK